MSLASIWHFKEKPLWISVSIDIILQEKVILMVWDLCNQWQISTLESRLKDKCSIFLIYGWIKWRNLCFMIRLFLLLSPFIAYLRNIACPNIPVLIQAIHLSITLLLVLPVDYVLEGLPNPREHEILLGPRPHDMFVQRLKIRNDSNERRQRDHGGERFRLVADGLGK